MNRPPPPSPLAEWEALLSGADTAEAHACLDAGRRAGAGAAAAGRDEQAVAATAVAAYHRCRLAGTYAELNTYRITAGHAADLLHIAATGDTGARAVSANLRALALRRGWITATTADGQPATAQDWAATLRITPAGLAVARAAAARPVELTPAVATALAEVQRQRCRQWPGTPSSHRVAVAFRLVSLPPDGPAGRLYFHLTTAGEQALSRWRSPEVPTAAQRVLLQCLLPGGDRRIPHAAGTWQTCRRNGWLAGDPPQVSAAGRAALDAPPPPPAPAGTPRVPVPQLLQQEYVGKRVRLANRRAYRVGPQWVVLHRVQWFPPQGRMPGGYEVWVRDAPAGKPYSYCTARFHAQTRFEVAADAGSTT